MKKIAAAITLFTRIPIWKWMELPAASYSSAVVYWPLIGWLTGGTTALTIFGLSFIIPIFPAIVCGLSIRLLLTGALHEDGLADFCDGFGGGHTKEQILSIMKDSHIGTYGVIGLICYFLLTVSLLDSLTPLLAALAIFASDPFSKFCAAQLTNLLSYARPEGSKNKVSYCKMNNLQLLGNLFFGLIPLVPLVLINPFFIFSILLPLILLFLLVRFMKHHIGGYTGDCCGATYLICEAIMLLGIIIINSL